MAGGSSSNGGQFIFIKKKCYNVSRDDDQRYYFTIKVPHAATFPRLSSPSPLLSQHFPLLLLPLKP
jgi:hypothetical protein